MKLSPQDGAVSRVHLYLALNMTILNLTIFNVSIILEVQMCISGVSLLISIPKACNKIIFVCTAVVFGVFTDFLNCAHATTPA